MARLWMIALATSSLACGRDLPAQIVFQYQYAAKVVCGMPRQTTTVPAPLPPPPVVVQAYATSINVNNPSDSLTVSLRKRLVITFPPGSQIPQKPLQALNDSLLGKWALETDCQDLRKRYNLTQPFFEGFVVIQSTLQLDVTEVFTVPGGIDVVTVAERKIFVGQ